MLRFSAMRAMRSGLRGRSQVVEVAVGTWLQNSTRSSPLLISRTISSSQAVSALAVPKEPYSVNYHNPPPESNGYAFFMPRQSLIGPGSLKGIAPIVKSIGLKKALIVTDGFMSSSGATKAITDVLDTIGVTTALYDSVQPNPTDVNVDDGVAAYKAAGCDFLVSFGGGSSHDCAKAIALVASNGGRIHDYQGVDVATEAFPPLVAINTTAGTASEMTRFLVITDTSRHVKMAIVDAKITPTVAVDDPSLMVGMPKGLTAATGMDALTHAIEAYMSIISNPVTDASALHAIKLITVYLGRAVADGHDLQARDMMSYAQFLAGMAFNSASLGYVHAMAHQPGGFYNLPHGVCNAVILPVVQEFNASAVPYRFVDVAEAMGLEYGADPMDAPAAVIKAIRQLSAEVGIPRNLRELGVKPEDFDLFAEQAMKDVCALTNPRTATHADIVALYKQAYDM